MTSLAQVAIQLPADNTSVRFTPQGSGFTLEVADPGNHAWMLQSSSDLTNWSNVTTHRVFNGSLRIPLGRDGTQRFFRLDSDLAGSVSSSAANALLLPATTFNYANPTLPQHLLAPPILAQDNTPAANPTTNAGATLGRVLFYDKRLSANQTISCSSCHQAEHGFADSRRFSVGFNGGLTGRNSMGLTNNRYYLRGHYFWDERANTLEDQVLLPIQNSVEMGMTLDAVVARVSAEPYYAELFTSAFGSSQVNSTRISRALAQFVRSIVSGSSKYDQGVATNFSNFTAQENQGRNIFVGGRGGCAACHGSDNFVPGNAIFNNGIENPSVDLGIGGITLRAQDVGSFKVPSLRNIELTGPYMHDGRFATLEEVVEFYNSGVTNNPNLSPQLRAGGPGGPPRRLNLTNGEKAALVAFLKTLTDTTVTSDPKFSDPFRYDAK